MVNVQELEAKRHILVIEVELDVAWIVLHNVGLNNPRPASPRNGGINQLRVVDENREGVIPPQRQLIVRRGRAQHLAHMIYEEDDIDLDFA